MAPGEQGTGAAADSDPGGGHGFSLPGFPPGQVEVPQPSSFRATDFPARGTRRPEPTLLLKAVESSRPLHPCHQHPEASSSDCTHAKGTVDYGFLTWEGSGLDLGFTSQLAMYADFIIVSMSLLLLLKLCIRSLCSETLR